MDCSGVFGWLKASLQNMHYSPKETKELCRLCQVLPPMLRGKWDPGRCLACLQMGYFPLNHDYGRKMDNFLHSRKLTAGGPQNDGPLEKVTGPFKHGNFWYLFWISGVYVFFFFEKNLRSSGDVASHQGEEPAPSTEEARPAPPQVGEKWTSKILKQQDGTLL